MDGDTSDYLVHLKGCNQLQRSRHFSRVVSLPTQQLNSICNFLNLLARTTSHDIQPHPFPGNGRPFAPPTFESSQRCVEYMYGITPSIANALQKTCQLTEYLAFYDGEDVPSEILTACEELGDELAVSTVNMEAFVSINPKETAMIEIVQCQARAWHAAVVIYYYRTIQKCDPHDLENERVTILENLIKAEDIKDNILGGEKRPAPISWPAFMAALEATDREPWRQWWTRIQDYNLGNFIRQQAIIEDIWAIMDRDEDIIDWRSALRSTGRLVLAI
jgi:arginine metabolism regulation protein II